MRVLKKGRRVTDSQLAIAVLPNQAGQARLGMAIAKRSIPRAVDRNSIKRQVREVFRQYPNLPELDLVVLTRRTTHADKPKAVRASALSLLHKIVRNNSNDTTSAIKATDK